MRKIITLALLVLTATAGSAMADRYRGSRDHGRDRVVVRDQRNDRGYNRVPSRSYDRGYNRGYNRGSYHRDHRYNDRRAIHSVNGRFVFNGGYVRSYHRPVFTQRYTSYRYRPSIIVENYDPVPGYIWVAGNWNWTGYEWSWIPGHYAVDASYEYSY
jgi:hypothetical protein